MYTIWTGPYHLDFKFDLPEDKFCRLQLNFKVSQGCHLKIENLITEIQPAEKVFPSELFTFCAEAIVSIDKRRLGNKWTPLTTLTW